MVIDLINFFNAHALRVYKGKKSALHVDKGVAGYQLQFRTFVIVRNTNPLRANMEKMDQHTKLGAAVKHPLDTSYLPVPWECREVIEEAIESQSAGKVFYFCHEDGICEAAGSVIQLEEVSKKGLFVVMDTGLKIRADRVITLFGKPGAAYDEYNAYGNACMDCLGGYDKEEL